MGQQIEFSKGQGGKVLIGIGCRRTIDGEYQKILSIDDIGNNPDVKVGDFIKMDEGGENLAQLIFNKDESIDILIKKLKELKHLDSKRTLEEQKEISICDDPECSCQLTRGC